MPTEEFPTGFSKLGRFPHLSTSFSAREFEHSSIIEKDSEVNVTTAQVLALFATPVELVPAPGANRFLNFKGAMIFLDYAGTAYAGIAVGENLVIKYTNAAGDTASSEIETVGFLDQANDEYRWAIPGGVDGAVLDRDVTALANQPLVLHLLVGEIITGNSPLKIQVIYDEFDLSHMVDI